MNFTVNIIHLFCHFVNRFLKNNFNFLNIFSEGVNDMERDMLRRLDD